MAKFFKVQKPPRPNRAHIVTGLKVERLSDDGRGVASFTQKHSQHAASSEVNKTLKGKTVFIDGALPSETVTAKVVNDNPRYCDANVIDVVEKSPHRTEPMCTHAKNCGGCHVQHMSIQLQHEFKQRAALGQLKSWSGIIPETILPVVSAKEYHYRRRVRLGVYTNTSKRNSPLSKQESNRQVILGFRQKQSKQLIKITQCPVMTVSLEAFIEPLQLWLNNNDVNVKQIELIDSEPEIGLIVQYSKVFPLPARKSLAKFLISYDVKCWYQSERQNSLEDEKGDIVKAYMSYELTIAKTQKTLRLAFQPQDFIQSNGRVNQLMADQLITLLDPKPHERIIDLFCGIGNFTLAVSSLVRDIIGIEGVKSMIETAKFNAQENQCKSARFLQGDLFKWSEIHALDIFSEPFDSLILDPPRTGAKVICENIDKLMPKRIVYISCDSATFARDAQLLCERGYKLSHLGLIDMFAQTSHSELMGLFVR